MLGRIKVRWDMDVVLIPDEVEEPLTLEKFAEMDFDEVVELTQAGSSSFPARAKGASILSKHRIAQSWPLDISCHISSASFSVR